jgi:hypothetical protein
MREDSDFDRLIDVALGTYAEADRDLERRVLVRIADERASGPRIPKLTRAAILTATACLLAVMTLRPKPPRPPEARASSRIPLQQAPQKAMRVETLTVRPENRLPHHALPESTVHLFAASRLPKREVFPTPQPLSPTERALANFAAHAPEAERKSFIDAQAQSDEPIHIAEIQIEAINIPPLESPDSNTN